MSYPWPSSQQVSLNDASAMTSAFRTNKTTILNSSYASALCNSETFNLQEVNSLLAVQGAAGLRIYNGMDENYNVHAILVAVDEEGNDIVPSGSPLLNDPAILLEQGIRCPPTCPEEDSPLNS